MLLSSDFNDRDAFIPMAVGNENTRVTRAAGIVGASTLLSRIFGVVRDMVFAWFFGAGLISDAFFVAFRIPNLLRRLFAEGSLSIAFIPVFTEYLNNKGKAEAFQLAGSALRLLSLILVFISVAGILLSPLVVRIIAPGFGGSLEKYTLTVTLTRIMFPYIFFIGLVALCMGILNVLGHFAAPALAPVFLNLAMIGSVFWLAPRMHNPVKGLAWGVLIGGGLQLVLQIPFLINKGIYFWRKIRIYHPGIKRIGLLMIPAVFGAAVYQINILVGTLLASLLAEGSVSYLYYADRLVQFPLGIFAIATATAVLPSLSREAASKDFEAMRDTFAHAMSLVFFITVPSMIGLIVLREPIVALLFKRGAFDATEVRLTAYALLYYAIGLWAFSGVRIVVSAFYSLQDTKTPVQIAIISVIGNIILGIILMQPLGHGGLALSTSLASMLNLGLLIHSLRKKMGSIALRLITRSAGKTLFCSALMGIVVWGLALGILPQEEGSSYRLLGGLCVCIGSGFLLYFLFAYLMKSPEMEVVLNTARRGLLKP